MRLGIALVVTSLIGCASTPPASTTASAQSTSAKTEAHVPLTQAQVNAEIAKVQRANRAEQFVAWRKWAADFAEPTLQSFALMQLAWAEESTLSALAAGALESPNQSVRAVAARVLAHVDKANQARPALLDALAASSERDRAPIVWALVVGREKTIATAALEELRKGSLDKVTRLDGGSAFDPSVLAALFSVSELVVLAKDNHSSVRRLAAIGLGAYADSKAADALIALLADTDDTVGGAAAGGLARMNIAPARDALVDALQKVDKDRRHKLLESIRDIAGGPGLVATLASIRDKPVEAWWFQTQQVFEMLHSIADPRVGDSMFAWASAPGRHKHWLGEAGRSLAEVGDLRAAKLLADRLRIDSSKIYNSENFWEADQGGHLSHTDRPRLMSLRMLADLARLHPEGIGDLKAKAEDAAIFWLNDVPEPHANGMRFLAAIRSDKALTNLRAWAFPPDPLPKPGASPPFPVAFERAQMAQRYLGMWKDEPSYAKLLGQLQRKTDPKLDITQDALVEMELAMLGMALRAIAYGAAEGLSEWQDPRAIKPLMTFIEDETWHEEARAAACDALAWCSDGKTIIEVAKKAIEFGNRSDPRKQFIGSCYAQTLRQSHAPDVAATLVQMFGPSLPAVQRTSFARALGATALDAQSSRTLEALLRDPQLRTAAALALILGGNSEIAARTVAMYSEFGKEAMSELMDEYYRALGFWTHDDFARGNVYRWVENAEAIGRVEVEGVRQEWARQRLMSQFENLRYDNGPHSMTRVVLRYRLYQDAKSGNAANRRSAIRTLQFMNEQGVLMALCDESGEVGNLARKALHVVKNPELSGTELQPSLR